MQSMKNTTQQLKTSLASAARQQIIGGRGGWCGMRIRPA